jgi:hypothetical protein
LVAAHCADCDQSILWIEDGGCQPKRSHLKVTPEPFRGANLRSATKASGRRVFCGRKKTCPLESGHGSLKAAPRTRTRLEDRSRQLGVQAPRRRLDRFSVTGSDGVSAAGAGSFTSSRIFAMSISSSAVMVVIGLHSIKRKKSGNALSP